MRKSLSLFALFISLVILGFNINLFTAIAPMQEAMNPEIRIAGSTETEINCEVANPNDQFTFEVDYTDTRSTESYEMNTIPYAPLIAFNDVANLGTEIDFNGNDKFSPTINFFQFSFFDETTSELAIGENGVISMDPLQGGDINLRYPSADLPNSNLTRNSIFAAHYDLRIDGVPGASVYYNMIGTFPARKMVITYVDAEVFYCTDNRTTSVQVVLEELTNKIQIFIKDKVMACGAISNAVVGIQDKYGTLGYSPAGRNYSDGNWGAQNEAYEFTPNGARLPSIAWIEGGYTPNDPSNNIIGTGEQITVNADLSNLQYTVEVRYPNYRNQQGEIVDLILHDDIPVSPFYPIALDDQVIMCSNTVDLNDYNNYVSLNPAGNFTITYYYDEGLTNPIPNPTNFSFTGDSITIYAQVAYDGTCYDVSSLEISSVLGFLQIDSNNLELYICDNVDSNNLEGVENNHAVTDLDEYLFGNIPNGDINYYSSSTSTTPLNQLNITDGTQVWVDVLVEGENSCRTPRIGPITIRFYEVPEFLSIPSDLQLVLCDKDFNYREEFDENQTWQSFLADNGLVTNDPNHTITVYETEEDAIAGTNALTQVTMDQSDVTYNPTNNSREAQLFIRIEDDNGCFSIKEITARIRFYGVKATDTPLFNFCVNEGTSIPVDLSCFLANADFNNDGNFGEGMFNQIYFEDGTTSNDINDVYDISYHNTEADAKAGINEISENQTITTADVGNKTFYVRFTLCESCTADGDDCYTVKKIRFRVVTTKPNTQVVDVCYENENSTFVPNLNIFNLQLFDNPNSYTIEYYETQNDANNQTNQITEYTFTGNNYLWVRIKSNLNFNGTSCFDNPVNPCEGVYRIQFVFGAQIEAIDFPEQQIQGVCDNNADGEELFDVTIFEEDIYQGEASFEYYNNLNETTLVLSSRINDPTQVLFAGADGSATKTIYAKLNFDDSSCYQIVRLTITLNFIPPILTENAFLCACLPNPGQYATYDLTQAVESMFSTVNAQNGNDFDEMQISYHNFYNDALDGTNEIFNIQNYSSIRGNEEIYVRFYSPESTCYSVDTLTLKNLVLPVPIPGVFDVCDTNINGKPDIIFSDLDNIVMPNNTEGYFFSYYWTYEDAENAVNPIISTEDAVDPIDFFYEFNTLPEKVYVRVDSDNGECPESAFQSGNICSGINEVILNVGDDLNINIAEFDLPPVCDTFDETGEIDNPSYNDGIADGIDLTQSESEIILATGANLGDLRLLYYETLNDLETDIYPYGNNVIEDPTNYTNINSQGLPIEQVYVKIEYTNNNYCPIYVILNITVLNGPELFPDEVYYICPDSEVDILLDIPMGEDIANYSFEWTLPDGTIITDQHELLNATQIGIYSVRITDNRTNCSSPIMNFSVQEIDPPHIINLVVENESSITVVATGFEDLALEYSLDGINFQNSNTFHNLDPGLYTVWVRYIYNNRMCVSEPKSTILIEIFNVITPNGDGYNDCISFDNLHVFGNDNSTLIMYDRYGKVIFTEKSNSVLKWCGHYGGRVLPSTNYWYKLIIPDGREKTGYITLKNY